MKCPFCNRKPKDIPEYRQVSKNYEMSPNQFVMMEDITFDGFTDMFCCKDCYIALRYPPIEKLHQMYRAELGNVIPIFM